MTYFIVTGPEASLLNNILTLDNNGWKMFLHWIRNTFQPSKKVLGSIPMWSSLGSLCVGSARIFFPGCSVLGFQIVL